MSLDLEEILIRKGTTRNRMTSRPKGLLSNYDDIWLLDGVRTAFADYNTVLGLVSPIDLGIKVAREVGAGSCRLDLHDICVDVADGDDIVTLAGEAERHRPPQAPQSAGDDRDPVFHLNPPTDV